MIILNLAAWPAWWERYIILAADTAPGDIARESRILAIGETRVSTPALVCQRRDFVRAYSHVTTVSDWSTDQWSH